MAEHTATVDELLSKIEQGWSEHWAYVKTLTADQLTKPTDAAGWTVLDHLMHLVVWEDSMNALLEHKERGSYIGVNADTWKSRDFDKINEEIRVKHQGKSLQDITKAHEDVHQRLVTQIRALSDEDLKRPYSHYQPDSTNEAVMVGWLEADTYKHYAEHRPWMDAIAKSG